MNILVRFIGTSILLSTSCGLYSQPSTLPQRMIIAQRPITNCCLLPLQSAAGFTLIGTDHAKQQVATPFITLSVVRGTIAINGVNTFRKQMYIAPNNNQVTYAGSAYNGSLRVACTGTTVTVTLYGQPHKKTYPLPQHVQRPTKKAVAKQQRQQKKVQIVTPVVTQTVPTTSPAIEVYAVPEQMYAYNVRVLLDEHPENTSASWRLVSSQGFVLVDPETEQRSNLDDQELIIKQRHGSFFINGNKYYKKSMYVVPRSGFIACNDKVYGGSMLLAHHQQTVMLINSLEIEDYVYCVLKTESWPGWPLEVNKAFAIASRSYVIAMVFRAKTSKIPYHIKNTNAHQTYSGHHQSPVLKQAVEETKGIFLAYNKQPIVAMFDICCGGIVPAKMADVDFVKAPYLARGYACHYCKPTKMYHWQAQYSEQEIRQALKEDFPTLKHIKHISIHKKDQAGLARKLTLTCSKKEYSITGKRLRLLLPKIKSLCFSVTHHGDTFTFKGRGRGHHLGICQWGAREMVRKGYDYKEILDFYYPNTTFMRLA